MTTKIDLRQLGHGRAESGPESNDGLSVQVVSSPSRREGELGQSSRRPPGPTANPAVRLADAAILYAAALEAELKRPKREWDRLVKAALAYQHQPRRMGRPRLGATP